MRTEEGIRWWKGESQSNCRDADVQFVCLSLTGRPDFLSSARSLTLPPTIHASTPLTFILVAMIPPSAAQVWPDGCSMTTTVPSSAISTQCLPFGTTPGSVSVKGGTSELFPTSLRVEAGPMIFGCSSIEPCKGDFGANGTASHWSDTYSQARTSGPRDGRGVLAYSCRRGSQLVQPHPVLASEASVKCPRPEAVSS